MFLNALWSIGGVIVLLAIGYGLSNNRKAINWRTIGGGVLILFALAFFVFKTTIGAMILGKMSQGINLLMDYATEGVDFLVGPIVAHDNLGTAFVFTALPAIVFFSSLIAILYHLGIMQKIINVIGGGLSKFLGTSKVESLNSAGNIFVGQTEAPLLIKPFIKKLTESELFAVMVAGFASVAGSILVGYAALGIELKYLITASFMAAPSALIMAKLFIPETNHDQIQDITKTNAKDDTGNVFDAAAGGASDGLKLAANVAAMLFAFIALLALVNGIVGFVGGWFGLSITLEQILGYVFAPLAFVIGIPFDEAARAASFIGQKFVLNEFVAFSEFAPVMSDFSPRTQVITTFALTGFANLGCIGIQLGGIGSMAPNRRKDIARLGVKAVIAATLANLLSAAVAGLFIL